QPSRLVVALGKTGDAYLIDRTTLGGVGAAVAHRHVSEGPIINAATAYTTAGGSYVVFRGRGVNCPSGQSGDLIAIRIGAAAPPTTAVAWGATVTGGGWPIVTTSDGRSEAIVWTVGAEGDNRLHGLDGETGQPVFDGGGPGDHLSFVRRFQTPIVAK